MPNAFTETIVQIAAGAVSGAVGSPLLEAVIPPTVTTAGNSAVSDSFVNEGVIRVLLAFMVGGMLKLIIGLVKS